MLSIAESLGTLNSILISSAITLGLAFWAYKNHEIGTRTNTCIQIAPYKRNENN